MKLIDLLVKELPARGGWPEGTEYAVQDIDGEIKFGKMIAKLLKPSSTGVWHRGAQNEMDRFNSTECEDWQTSIVTREQYEAAISKPEIGVKHDSGKFRFSLLPWNAVKEVIDVLEFGAKKYAPDNWKRVDDHRDRYFNATIRHVTAWYAGEKNDPETGLNHLAHAVCCLLFLIWFDKNEQN